MPSLGEPKRSRLQQSKITASTTAIQPLEITTTAVVGNGDPGRDGESEGGPMVSTSLVTTPPSISAADRHGDDIDKKAQVRKPSRHQHHHHVKSPQSRAIVSDPLPTVESPVSSGTLGSVPETALLLALPPAALSTKGSGPSEAMAALHHAAQASSIPPAKAPSSSLPSTLPPLSIVQLFESCFFSAILLVHWSNVVGPRIEKVWSEEPMSDGLLATIGGQVLHGEMGHALSGVECKWVLLHRQAIVCTGFLFNDAGSLYTIVFVVPKRYLRNFSQYFKVLRDRVPTELIAPLIRLRATYPHYDLPWSVVLDHYASKYLVRFVRSIMDLESVSLPIDTTKVSQTLLGDASRPLLDTAFMARAITSFLQTSGSALLLGNTLTTVNMMINTLALLLSPKERARSSHARKNHAYMPDLYLQGLLIQDVAAMDIRLETALLDSLVPTTLIDMTRLTVKQTSLLPVYQDVRARHLAHQLDGIDDDLAALAPSTARSPRSAHDNTSFKRHGAVVRPAEDVAPMVLALLGDLQQVPERMREAYLSQWRRWLQRRVLALVKYVHDETPDQPGPDMAVRVRDALDLRHAADLAIVLAQAEKLCPGILDFIHAHWKTGP